MNIADLILDYPKQPPFSAPTEDRESFDVNDKNQVYDLIQELMPEICGKETECSDESSKLRVAWLVELMLESDYGNNLSEVDYRELAKSYVLNNFKKAKERQDRLIKALDGLNKNNS
jgi:hypothetical protein